MSRKTINVFSVSFLDLLSGALAAVIILFIIVPKMDVEAKEASEKLNELGLEVQQLDSMMTALQNSVPTDLYEEIQAQIELIRQELEQSQKIVEQLEQKIEQLQTEVEDLKKYKEWMDDCGFRLVDECPPPQKPAPPQPVSVGFSFKSDNVVFIIDCSGSMLAANNEDSQNRLPSVKAGLKMLIASMPDDFAFDIVRFPFQEDFDIGANWKTLRKATLNNKEEAYKYLYDLEAGGGTPTRKVLEYALQQYPDLTDIVLLTDGQPTTENGEDDIGNLLATVKNWNTKNIQINTIGVGRSFFKSKNDPKVVFLRELAAQNGNGFFIDFY